MAAVDVALGGFWTDATQGRTALPERCGVALDLSGDVYLDAPRGGVEGACRPWVSQVLHGDFSTLPDDPNEFELSAVSLGINGYATAQRLGRWGRDLIDWVNNASERVRARAEWPEGSLDLWMLMFGIQRGWRVVTGSGPAEPELIETWRQTYLRWRTALRDERRGSSTVPGPRYVPFQPIPDTVDLRILVAGPGLLPRVQRTTELLAVIWEEAWQFGGVDRARYHVHVPPSVQPETVRLRQGARPRSEYSGEILEPDDAWVVVAAEPDGGDGVETDRPYFVSGDVRFRVPWRARVRLTAFDYSRAVAESWFPAKTGAQWVQQSGVFDFEGIVPVNDEEGRRAYMAAARRTIVESTLSAHASLPEEVQETRQFLQRYSGAPADVVASRVVEGDPPDLVELVPRELLPQVRAGAVLVWRAR